MRITVDRTTDHSGNLVFVVTCRDPACTYVKPEDVVAIKSLQAALEYMNSKSEGINLSKVSDCIHGAKEVFFGQLKRVIPMAIVNDLDPMYKAMVQEIYNWTMDAQEPQVRHWMLEFDPERTKYYFNNDNKEVDDDR